MSSKILTILFVIGITLITCTQLRLPGLPVGPGEIVLILLGIYTLSSVGVKKFIRIDQYMNVPFLQFWCCFGGGILIACIYNGVDVIHDKYIIHDLLAYFFIVYVLVLFVNINKRLDVSMGRVLVYLIVFNLLFYFLLYIVSFLNANDTNTGLWLFPRFEGLSKNKNQLALVFSIIPFILLHIYRSYASYKIPRIMLVLLCFICVYIGYATWSRSLLVAWFVSFFCLLLLFAFNTNNKYMRNGVVVFLFLAVLLLFVNKVYLFNLLFDAGKGTYSHRLELLNNSIELIYQSFIFGYGPGPHVFSYVNTTHLWEAHNTFVDVALQAGLFGLTIYSFLLYKVTRKIAKQTDLFIFSAFIALIIFSCFHFVFRQPIFWFYLFSLYYFSSESSKCVE